MSKKIKLALSAELLTDDLNKIKEKYEVKILPWIGTDYLPTKEDIINECSGDVYKRQIQSIMKKTQTQIKVLMQ